MSEERPNYFVEIVRDSTKEVVHRIGPIASSRRAIKVANGADINLDHDNYFVRVVPTVEDKE